MRTLVGLIAFILYTINTIFWCLPIFVLSVFKLIPLKPLQTKITACLDWFATAWIAINNMTQNLTTSTQWSIEGAESLSMNDWYLVIANHQSWVDILVLQRVFNRKIPFLKFFLKQSLIWVPFLGLAWWALEFPFMKRFSRAFLEKNPHLKGKDLETTRKACEKFKHMPTSIMNFVEGTRFNDQKKTKQGSPYQHLLTPRAGGIAYVLGAMGEQLHTLIDVSIYYPNGIPTFWMFISGQVPEVKVKIEQHSLTRLTQLDYFSNGDDKAQFQAWLNQFWQNKDETLSNMACND